MLLEIQYSEIESQTLSIFNHLSKGEVIVLRNVPQIFQLRHTLISIANEVYGKTITDELLDLFNNQRIPKIEIIHALTQAFDKIRTTFYLPTLLTDLVELCKFPKPASIECGEHRLLFPPDFIKLCQSRTDLFSKYAFVRKNKRDPSQIFTLEPVPPHRDINIPHYNLMANFWMVQSHF